MKTCAFLTIEDLGDYVTDDHLAHEPFATIGWRVVPVPWTRDRVPWGGFDAVVIRSPWDYQKHPDAFVSALEKIERAGPPVFNELEVVRWNLRKTYLADLADRGVSTVPTRFLDRIGRTELEGAFAELDTHEMVVKPVVSANAEGAFRLTPDTLDEHLGELEDFYADRRVMAQPFVGSVLTEGEYSLIYFAGEFSHCVLKVPRADDFRVQEEHGGLVRPAEPEPELLATGAAAIGAIGNPPLYARVDAVRSGAGNGFWIMELELIEPSLYLRMDDDAAQRFARAFDAMTGGSGWDR